MAAGLFELRKDAITGWWVATVVDRAFHRDRFALRADTVDDDGKCQNCTEPPGDGVRVRTLKDYAFHVVGTDAEARAHSMPASSRSPCRRRSRPGAGGPRSRHRTSIGRCTPSAPTRSPSCSPPAGPRSATRRRPD